MQRYNFFSYEFDFGNNNQGNYNKKLYLCKLIYKLLTMVKKNLIRFDWAMKRLFRNKADYTVLEGFLSVLLGKDIKIINLNESESNQTHPDEKFNRVDVLAENSKGELIIVELQNSWEVDYLLRMLYGVSKAITEQVNIGKRYGTISKVYHINIIYFKLGDGQDYVYHGVTDFRGIHKRNVLALNEKEKEFFMKKTAGEVFPEYYILCVHDFGNKVMDELDEWMFYFKNTEIPEYYAAPGLPEARELLIYDNLSEEEKKAYNHHLKQTRYEQNVIDDSFALGQFEGLKQGEAIAMEHVVVNCKKNGFPLEQIQLITQLSNKQIVEILKRNAFFDLNDSLIIEK